MSYASRVRGTASPKKSAPSAKFIAGLSGLQVTIELVSGESYKGVLLQKSNSDTYYIGQAQLLTKEVGITNLNRFEEERDFDIARVACIKVHKESKGDRDEPSSGFKTDSEISSKKGDKAMRNLTKWDDGGDIGSSMSLDQEAKLRPEERGWDQFKVNQKLFGYQSSYAEEDYTTSIDRQSEFYRQNQPVARKVAAEIENEVSSNSHVAEERGRLSEEIDEESRYSTVLDRPENPNVYRPPALRNKSPEKDRSSRPPSNSSSRESSKYDRSPPKNVSLPKTARTTKDVESEDMQPAEERASVPEKGKKSPQKSVGSHDDSKQTESGDDPSKKFQFNAGAKEFVPTMPMPGLYFADGSYMPVIDNPAMPSLAVYPAYPFNPYANQYAPMGYQPMMYPVQGNYPAYLGQQGQHPNRSRVQARASKPNHQPNASDQNGNS